MKKLYGTTALLTTMGLILAACGSPRCPEGYQCIPYTPTLDLNTATPDLSTPTPSPTPAPPTQTPMLESSLAYRGINFKPKTWLMLPINPDGHIQRLFEYRRGGWDENNPDCKILPNGILESSGDTACKIFPFEGLRAVVAFENSVLKETGLALLWSYGGRVVEEKDLYEEGDGLLVGVEFHE